MPPMIAKFLPEKGHDEGVYKIIESVNQGLNGDDDFLLLVIGPTGTGKSSLMLHFYEAFDPEGCDIKYIGLNRYAHAEALKNAKDKPDKRFCSNDEADISKRDHATKYNKNILKLMWQIRGLNIWHWWNNPSGDMIDKPLIEERINGVIYMNDKSKDKPRIYHYFTKKALIEIFEKEKNLKWQTLEKYKRLAFYVGAFTKYEGKLKKDYLVEKEKKMASAVDDFAEFMKDEQDKLGIPASDKATVEDSGEEVGELNINKRSKLHKLNDIAEFFGYTPKGFRHVWSSNIKRFLVLNKDYVKQQGSTGMYMVFDDAIPKIEKIMGQTEVLQFES